MALDHDPRKCRISCKDYSKSFLRGPFFHVGLYKWFGTYQTIACEVEPFKSYVVSHKVHPPPTRALEAVA